MGPLLTPFGRFEFDLAGRVACAYSLLVLALALLLARRVVHSPFGLSLQALRDNRLRAASIGLSVHARLVAVYTLAAAVAGAAGALLAQTTRLRLARRVRFPPQRRGPARARDRRHRLPLRRRARRDRLQAAARLLSAWTPQYWNFWLGLFLVVLVLVGRDGGPAVAWFRRAAHERA